MTAKKKVQPVISDEKLAEIMQPKAFVVEEPKIVAPKVGDVIKTYVQNGIAYKRVVTETGTVDLKV